ncbi:unnamed protein product, partial [Candidula unifasciata]
QHIGEITSCTSVSACAVRTKQMYPHSKSFMFNAFLNTCLPGGRLDRATTTVKDAEGHLYVELKAPPNLSVISQNEATACIGIFQELLTYNEAAQRCQDMGYFLASVKNSPKLNLIVQLAGDKSLWVGCDDAVKEGRVVWKEDGSTVSTDTLATVFIDSEVNNFVNQDCCVYRNDSHKLSDYDCSVLLPYVCEVTLYNCVLNVSGP